MLIPEELFIIKNIKRVMTSYTNDPSFTFSPEELKMLVHEINEQIKEHPEEDLLPIIHNVVYEYVTTYF